MSGTPERIWVKERYNSWGQYGEWYAHSKGGGVEYIRAARIEELEAKLSKVMLFVSSFAHRARTDEHDKDEMFLLDLSNLRFERDCDITQARTILAELKGDKTQ